MVETSEPHWQQLVADEYQGELSHEIAHYLLQQNYEQRGISLVAAYLYCILLHLNESLQEKQFEYHFIELLIITPLFFMLPGAGGFWGKRRVFSLSAVQEKWA